MPCNIMSATNPPPEVTTSTGDVYPTPIALGFPESTDVDTSIPSTALVLADTFTSENEFPSAVGLPQRDVTDGQTVRGRCGLYNLGNTCFMNSGVQCLMHTIPLVQCFRDLHLANPHCDMTLLGQFKLLFAKIWSGRFSILYPQEFKQVLGMYHPQFQDFRQHDCQEFLALLLDTLHENLNVNKMVTNSNTALGSGGAKQPIRFEDNINNRLEPLTNQNKNDKRQEDQSRNAVTSSHSQLTYDNMKEEDAKNVASKKVGNKMDSTRSMETGLFPFTMNQISEDSNHSNISEHSSDSDQCSVIKNLKLRSSPVVSQSTESLGQRELPVCDLKEADVDVTSSFDVNGGKDACCRRQVLKRAKSLEDVVECGKAACSDSGRADMVLLKSSSDNDLVKCAMVEADGDIAHCESDIRYSNIKHLNSVHSVVGDYTEASRCDGDQMASGSNDDGHVLLNNAVSALSVPSLEDLCAKESKTLNTNVLATAYMNNSVNVDSEKFAKHDNTTGNPDVIEEELLSHMQEATGKKDEYGPGRIKDVNIRADKKSRSPKGACSANFCGEKEDCYVLNSVKRMKFEGTEKNLQIQEMSKINKEKMLDTLMGGKRSNICDSVPSTSRLIDSDAESYTMEVDPDMELSDDEEEEREEDMEMVRGEPVSLAMGASYTVSEVLAAEEAWRKYLDRNNSIVVNSFQGQFKSTVVCAECSQVSVTFEPFMYLSVPIPNAMERQICVTFISWHAEPTQYLLVMHKQDKMEKVKQDLRKLIGRESSNLILAEVLDWHISRILEDNTLLRFVNDSSRKIYAFEVNECSLDEAEDQSSYTSTFAQDQPTSTTSNTQGASTTTTLASAAQMDNAQADVFSHMGTFSGAGTNNLQYNTLNSLSYDKSESVKGFSEVNPAANTDFCGTGLWEWSVTGQSSEKLCGSLETKTAQDTWPVADSTTSSAGLYGEGSTNNKGDNSVSSTSAVKDEWKSCAICLEELPDAELMVHTTCSGTFCPNCLEMSVQHYKDTTYSCPVCSTPAEMTEDFVPLTNAAQHKPKTRIVTIPISYRCETDLLGDTNAFLFSHPSLVSLPSNLSGSYIYSLIQQLLPVQAQFRILLTDGTGLRCSRCLYMEHCQGCEIQPDGDAVLRPGDNLTVSVTIVTADQLTDCQTVVDDETMQSRKSSEPTTLQDCFTAFTQSEELDEHNPWFCPHCKKNQRAKKTMTVWQYPDTLIIHLKRFVFHELSSTKVDQKVVFPIDNLDLDQFISGPNIRCLQYSLYSLVCHFGGSNSGHYTAYGKHPVTGQWYYYNDETVSLKSPGEEEFVSTYVLFYQRKGTDIALQMSDDLDIQLDPSDLDTGAAPSLMYKPPEGEITLTKKPAAVSMATSTNLLSPVTSSHELTSSSGVYDLVGSTSDPEGQPCGATADTNSTSQIGEADSTDVTLDFYS